MIFKRNKCNEVIFTITSDTLLNNKDIIFYMRSLKYIGYINSLKMKRKNINGQYHYTFYTTKELLSKAKKFVFETLVSHGSRMKETNIFKGGLLYIDIDKDTADIIFKDKVS